MMHRETDQLEAIERIATRVRKLLSIVAIAAIVIVLAAARAAASVLIPLVFALFLLAVFWPLQRRLQRRMPLSLATTLIGLLFLVILALFFGTLWWSSRSVTGQWTQYQAELNQYLELARQYGLPLAHDGSGAGAQRLLTRLADSLFTVSGALFLVIAYLVLGSLEITAYRAKLCTFLSSPAVDHWVEVAHEIAKDFQRYVVVRTGIGLLNGVLAGMAAWLLGLDFALIWGLLTFLLNYIPTIGSIIAVIFPVLFALVQFAGWSRPLLTLLILGGIQLVLGTVVDPLVQGRYLGPSPLVVLLSVAFWGWLWGIPGAFIAVPLTILVMITCRQFDRTRWIAILLADWKGEEDARQETGDKRQEIEDRR